MDTRNKIVLSKTGCVHFLPGNAGYPATPGTQLVQKKYYWYPLYIYMSHTHDTQYFRLGSMICNIYLYYKRFATSPRVRSPVKKPLLSKVYKKFVCGETVTKCLPGVGQKIARVAQLVRGTRSSPGAAQPRPPISTRGKEVLLKPPMCTQTNYQL